MGGRKGIAHIKVSQGSQFVHQQGLSLLFMAQLQLHLEEGLLLGDISYIVQEKDFSVLQVPDGFPSSRSAYIIDKLHRSSQKLLQHSSMRSGSIEILIFNIAALMSHHYHLGSLLRQLTDRGDTPSDPVDTLEGIGSLIHRLVHIHPTQDRLPLYIKFIQCFYSKAHVPLSSAFAACPTTQ